MGIAATWLPARTAGELAALYGVRPVHVCGDRCGIGRHPAPAPAYRVVTCGHCGQVIERDASGWRHRATGWSMCDVSARTVAVPGE